MNKKVLYLVHGAVIAALYVVLTLLANALGLANYAIQVRFSEALTILPVFTPAAIPGLFLGCIISNTLTGCMLLDIIFGSIATLIGAAGTWLLRNKGSTPSHYCEHHHRPLRTGLCLSCGRCYLLLHAHCRYRRDYFLRCLRYAAAYRSAEISWTDF